MTEEERRMKHIRRSVSNIVIRSEYMTVTGAKARYLRSELEIYMQKLWDGNAIFDFTVSVVILDEHNISVSVLTKVLSDKEFVLIQYLTPTKKNETDFDRAMKGI